MLIGSAAQNPPVWRKACSVKDGSLPELSLIGSALSEIHLNRRIWGVRFNKLRHEAQRRSGLDLSDFA